MLDCVCGAILPLRAARQLAQEQFHCGRPPPAALPRIRTRIDFTPARSDRARVTRALEKDRHVFHCGFNPLFPVHSKKIGTFFTAGLTHFFLVLFIKASLYIASSRSLQEFSLCCQDSVGGEDPRDVGNGMFTAVDKDRHPPQRRRLRETAIYPESRAPAGSNARSLRRASTCETGIVPAIFPVAPAPHHPE